VKRLAVLRHAKSSWADGVDDHDRPLNERGWKAARRIGCEMKHRGMDFDYVLASTAARVRETLDGVREKFDIQAEIHFEPHIYLATEEALFALVRELPDGIQAPLLVGHNPGLERLIVELTHDDKRGLRDQVARKYPTGALVVIDLPAKSWANVEPGNGEIAELILPRDLD
jgi:phosphohistidine phosphatase